VLRYKVIREISARYPINKAHALLKLLLKEVIKKNENIDKLFCSYFLKTVIFWLSEELEQNVWKA
jgi:hypothetical protein